ncbi:uncharacterized protein [Miscanthus floridulus]|uniref:uncharacterized protein n=1 Tax=Miscanthus floridulus TaxID=154761 RepID=UPI0034598FCD
MAQSYDYWKWKMCAHLKSMNRKVWEAVEKDFAMLDNDNPTPREEEKLQCNDLALNAIYDAMDERVFEQIKDLERAHDVWARLKESYEGTKSMKSAKLYILKDKFSSFKMKEDESIPEMFHRLQVIVNDLKNLGEKIEDQDFSHKFL